MFGKTGKSSNHRFGNPIDRKAHALRETEEKLRRDKERLERLLKEAPRLKEEREKRRREEFAHDPRFTRTSVMDQHIYRTAISPTFGRRKLRLEKRDGMWLFLVLVGVLASVVFWICHLLLM